MMLISDHDAAQLTDLAIRYTCAKLKIAEFGIDEHNELLSRIAARDAETHSMLTEFLASYRAWLEFHKEIDRQEKQGRLTGSETRRLIALTDRKDAARAQIVGRLKSIPA